MKSWRPSSGPPARPLALRVGSFVTGCRMAGSEVEWEQMEKWLDDHPDFTRNYFSRKATRDMIDSWVVSHAFEQETATSLGVESLAVVTGSRPSSGANTPVRKISAQELEKTAQILRPLVQNVDGTPTFLEPSSSMMEFPAVTRPKRNYAESKAHDERELLYELVMDVCNDLDVTSLCHKILQNVSLLLSADRCSLFLVHGDKNTPECRLVSKLFDVNMNASLKVSMERSEEISIPYGTGIVGFVAKTGECVNIADAYADPRFTDEIDRQTGYKTRSLLSMPIRDVDGDVIGVAQAINKISSDVKDEPFDEWDEKVFASYLAFCGIGLRNARLYEISQTEKRRFQVLLDLARIIFEEQSDVASLIHKIMLHVLSLMRCQLCHVFLTDDLDTDKGVFSRVFELHADDLDPGPDVDSGQQQAKSTASTELRFPLNTDLALHVLHTGHTVSIADLSAEPRFNSVQPAAGVPPYCSVLCVPVKSAQQSVIGAVLLTNKLDGTAFNKSDEHFFEAFALFCGMGIMNTQVYERAVKAMARQRVALDVLSYHAMASPLDVQRYIKVNIPTTEHYRLLDYAFSDFELSDDDTVKASLRMFLDMDFLNKFHISYEVLCNWLLSVKKNYRNVAYHNWRHAFNVAQIMFCMIQKGQLSDVLGDLECLALIVACLSHDLDHRGTNNQFQIKTMSPLAQLYSTSTMEHHHFDQCLMILNASGNEIFSGLSRDEYTYVIKVLENAILATDLALYFRFRDAFSRTALSPTCDWRLDENRNLLRSMLMTACDVACITKPWPIQKKVALLIYNEFFEQGDIERRTLNVPPSDMMNREKRNLLPTMQVGFIDSICEPVYRTFASVSESFTPLLDGCLKNRDMWVRAADRHKKTGMTDSSCHDNDNDDDDWAWRGSAEFECLEDNGSGPVLSVTYHSAATPVELVTTDNHSNDFVANDGHSECVVDIDNGAALVTSGNCVSPIVDGKVKGVEKTVCQCQGDSKRRRMSAPVAQNTAVELPGRKYSEDMSAKLRGPPSSGRALNGNTELKDIDSHLLANGQQEVETERGMAMVYHVIDECDGESESKAGFEGEAREAVLRQEKERLLHNSTDKSVTVNTVVEVTDGDMR